MTQRTCNIIFCCKGKGEGLYPINKIANYMSKECGVSPEEYLDLQLLFDIVKEAFLDYISTCDNPKTLLSTFFKHTANFNSELERMICALRTTKVMHNNTYINGFTADLIQKTKEILGDWNKNI